MRSSNWIGATHSLSQFCGASICVWLEPSQPQQAPPLLGLQLGLLQLKAQQEGSASRSLKRLLAGFRSLLGCWTEGLSSLSVWRPRLPFSIRQLVTSLSKLQESWRITDRSHGSLEYITKDIKFYPWRRKLWVLIQQWALRVLLSHKDGIMP